MFVKKDLRKVPKILLDGQNAIDNNDDEKVVRDLRLGRRQNEFDGSVRILCQPSALPALQNTLETLSLYDCRIQDLGNIGLLGNCPNLVHLNLGRNQLSAGLPDELSKLASLKELLLDDCELEGPFPKCILHLDRIETIRLSNNNIRTLPAEISLLSNLEVLAMDRNQLTEVPEELQDLTNLKTLLLRQNNIDSLPEGVPGQTMLNLALFHISSNKLTKLPDSLVECSSLTHVYVNGNQLEAIPFGMERLTNLQRVNLGHNKIEYLPTDFRYSFGDPDLKDPKGLCVGGKVSLLIECMNLLLAVNDTTYSPLKSPPALAGNSIHLSQ